MTAVHVRKTIYTGSSIYYCFSTQCNNYAQRVENRFIPKIDGNQQWHKEKENQQQNVIIPGGKKDKWPNWLIVNFARRLIVTVTIVTPNEHLLVLEPQHWITF